MRLVKLTLFLSEREIHVNPLFVECIIPDTKKGTRLSLSGMGTYHVTETVEEVLDGLSHAPTTSRLSPEELRDIKMGLK